MNDSPTPSRQPPQPSSDDFWSELIERGRQTLGGGGTTVDLYHLAWEASQRQFADDPAEAAAAARGAVESIDSIHARHRAGPLEAGAFAAAVAADMRAGPPEGPSSPLYPRTLPSRFFADPEKFLDACQRLGPRCLAVLWEKTPGCSGPLGHAASHTGKLKDGRRYVMLRLPPPQERFEGHFLAFVGQGAGSPPRMFALERGAAPEEAVLCERYPDGGRLRLGAAGPAESKNFIRLVRQQLGL